ncbi:hypothetical protein WA026_021029, partial [Henosepilachna vigintioctopunctata]
MSVSKCIKCDNQIKRNTKKSRKGMFHPVFLDIDEKKATIICENENIKYNCDRCIKNPKLFELKKMLNGCLIKMKEQNDLMNTHIEYIQENADVNDKKMQIKQKTSNANALLIKPIEDQKCILTKTDLSKDIDPTEVSKEFGNQFNVEESLPKNLKIAIMRAEEKYMNYENNQIIENTVDPNNLKENDVNAVNRIKIIRKYTVKSRKNTC